MRTYKSSFFTRRHYDLLGRLVGTWYINGYISDLQSIIEDLVDIFSRDNINFDEEKFIEFVKEFIEKNI